MPRKGRWPWNGQRTGHGATARMIESTGMPSSKFNYVYGPVASRRLGRSLGVDLVPFKTCTYDCVYCQLGRTTCLTALRSEYAPEEAILAELRTKLAVEPRPDYITLAGSGEPTLHTRIGDLIDGIKHLTRVPVAVLTNGSLLWADEIQEAIMEADLVMPSLDAGDESMFQRVNRPHPEISFLRMVDGLGGFISRFRRLVWLEVLLVEGLTSSENEAAKIAALARRIQPGRIQLNTVSRPPAESSARPVPAERLSALSQLFPKTVEIIAGAPPPSARPARRSPVTDQEILDLLARRPCTAQGVAAGLNLHPLEATKRLSALTKTGKVSVLRKDDDLFYGLPSAPAEQSLC
jgi:wyosine [tRNA(Phe)-imidazoG37] synthetase (radical SAM superfamily)